MASTRNNLTYTLGLDYMLKYHIHMMYLRLLFINYYLFTDSKLLKEQGLVVC